MRRIAPVILSIALVAAACGDDEQPQFCEDRDELQSSIDDLRELDLASEGVDGLNAQLQAIRDDIGDLAESAADEVRPEVDAVGAAIDDLQSSVAAAPGLADKVSALSAGLGDVASALQTLADATSQISCD